MKSTTKDVRGSKIPQGFALRTMRVPVTVDRSVPVMAARYVRAANWLSGKIFRSRELNANRLHKEFYGYVRRRFNLSSQLTCSLFRALVSCYKSAESNERWIRAEFTQPTIPLVYKRDFSRSSKKGGGVFLWKTPVTINGDRLPCGPWRDSKLCFDGEQWFLCLAYLIPIPAVKAEGLVAGADRGIRNVVVASVRVGTHTHVFQVGGGLLIHRRACIRGVRSRVQRVGTRGSRRLLCRLRGHERAVTRHMNHVVSKRLVAWAHRLGVKTLVLEDLTHIRGSGRKRGKRFRASINRWPFSQLLEFIRYKAQALGIDVQLVNPAGTSSTCPCCRLTARQNRVGPRFVCRKCGYKADADLVGSANIGYRFVTGGLVPSVMGCYKPPLKARVTDPAPTLLNAAPSAG